MYRSLYPTFEDIWSNLVVDIHQGIFFTTDLKPTILKPSSEESDTGAKVSSGSLGTKSTPAIAEVKKLEWVPLKLLNESSRKYVTKQFAKYSHKSLPNSCLWPSQYFMAINTSPFMTLFF